MDTQVDGRSVDAEVYTIGMVEDCTVISVCPRCGNPIYGPRKVQTYKHPITVRRSCLCFRTKE
mgnify:CR=1 FL=1